MEPRFAQRQMERRIHALDVSARHNEDETVEIRILIPHEAYRKDVAARRQDTVDRTVTKVEEP